MAYYNEQLLLLQQQVAQKKRQDSKLKELYEQRQELSARVCELEKIKLNEQADVDHLEGHSLAAFFYSVVGKMNEKLDKEKEEAYAAAVKYDTTARELSKVEDDIQHIAAEVGRLQGCELQYEKMLKTVAETIKALGSDQAVAILQIEENVAYIESKKKEINEAVVAGQIADYFFDGLFVDWAVMDKISQSKTRVKNTKEQIESVLRCLKEMEVSADKELENEKNRRDDLIVKAS